jgi:hypothetical protein
VFGFDHEPVANLNLPIFSAVTALDLPNGVSIKLVVHEGIYVWTETYSSFQNPEE